MKIKAKKKKELWKVLFLPEWSVTSTSSQRANTSQSGWQFQMMYFGLQFCYSSWGIGIKSDEESRSLPTRSHLPSNKWEAEQNLISITSDYRMTATKWILEYNFLSAADSKTKTDLQFCLKKLHLRAPQQLCSDLEVRRWITGWLE